MIFGYFWPLFDNTWYFWPRNTNLHIWETNFDSTRASGGQLLDPKWHFLIWTCNLVQPGTNLLQPGTNWLQPWSNLLQPRSNLLQPRSNLLQPRCKLVQTKCACIEPRCTCISVHKRTCTRVRAEELVHKTCAQERWQRCRTRGADKRAAQASAWSMLMMLMRGRRWTPQKWYTWFEAVCVNYHHPGPLGVWKRGPEPHLHQTFPDENSALLPQHTPGPLPQKKISPQAA